MSTAVLANTDDGLTMREICGSFGLIKGRDEAAHFKASVAAEEMFASMVSSGVPKVEDGIVKKNGMVIETPPDEFTGGIRETEEFTLMDCMREPLVAR
jgi:hypothetical protein